MKVWMSQNEGVNSCRHTCRQQICARFAGSSKYSESMKAVDSHEEDSSSGLTSHSQSRTCRITYCWTRTRLIPDPSKALKPKTRFSL